MTQAKTKTTTRGGVNRRPSKRQKTVTQLYREFEQAHAQMKALTSSPKEAEFERAVDKCDGIALTIVTTPARTFEEVFLKIRVALWSEAEIAGVRYDRLADIDHWKLNEASRWSGDEGTKPLTP